ncbi:hypothetical protein [Beijerinckia indica]|uniref:hypothetical protein n=1 Tax=Beijerinckia indica TaxID=533 RepID=UPI0005A130E9|nr:hypothetical protein [Beijerinckia indica]
MEPLAPSAHEVGDSDPTGGMVGVLSLVGHGVASFDAVAQVMGKGDVVALARKADQANWRARGLGPGHPPPFTN